ncbi:MAG: hypothetical protein SFY69_12735 [Planctomycetota bacterium]|nr:hypothetical protein [Planctomycetota bacterium]
MDTDFDALVEASRQGQNKMHEQALWKAAMNLPTWYFVARGAGEDAEPLLGALEGKGSLLIFTDEDRAADFAKRRLMRASDVRGASRDPASVEGQVLNMDVPDAVEYAKDLAKAGVEWALFNSGGYAFQTSLIDLGDKFTRYAAGR